MSGDGGTGGWPDDGADRDVMAAQSWDAAENAAAGDLAADMAADLYGAVEARYPNVRAAVEWGLSRPDPTPGRRLAAGVAWLWHLGQRGHDGLRLLRRAVALGRDERTALQAECLVALALVADTTEPGWQGYEAAHAARALADEVGAAATSRLARSLAAVGLVGTDLELARAEATRARDEAAAAGDTFVAAASACLVGLIHLVRDEHRAAIALLEPATAALLAIGERGVASSGLCWLAGATAYAGDVHAAVRLAEQAVRTAAPLRELHRTGLARAALAEMLVLAGRTGEAADALAPLDALAAGDEPVFVPARERAHAVVALAADRPHEALDWLRQERRWLPDGADRLVPASRLVLARALRRTGDAAAAAEVLDGLLATGAPAAALAAAITGPSVRASALDEQALLAPDGDRALALRHEALRIRAEHDLVLGCIDSLEAIAGDAGDRDVLLAAAAGARARTGYGGSGPAPQDAIALADAVALARRARGPRGRPSSGWASLTPTERSVVDLAALGLSNPDIAARLFIGRGTVKTHLAHVYAKLGVANRTDLARLAAGRTPS